MSDHAVSTAGMLLNPASVLNNFYMAEHEVCVCAKRGVWPACT